MFFVVVLVNHWLGMFFVVVLVNHWLGNRIMPIVFPFFGVSVEVMRLWKRVVWNRHCVKPFFHLPVLSDCVKEVGIAFHLIQPANVPLKGLELRLPLLPSFTLGQEPHPTFEPTACDPWRDDGRIEVDATTFQLIDKIGICDEALGYFHCCIIAQHNG